MEVTVIKSGENSRGPWALVEWKDKGWSSDNTTKMLSAPKVFEEGEVVTVPKVVLGL